MTSASEEEVDRYVAQRQINLTATGDAGIVKFVYFNRWLIATKFPAWT